MPSSEMLRRVALARTDVSEERSVHRLLVRLTLFLVADSCHPDDGGAKFFPNSVLTRATLRNISEDGILQKFCSAVTLSCLLHNLELLE
jgi:hypothetical protein